MKRTRNQKENSNLRPLSVLAVFLTVIAVYVGVLLVTQVKAMRDRPEDDGIAYTRSMTVSGLRGEIYDRNGTLLVGNSTDYDVILEYGAIPDTTAELNRSILLTYKTLSEQDCAHLLNTEYFPLEGTYPSVSYTANAKIQGSTERERLLRVLDANRLPQNASATELADTLVTKYSLSPDLYSHEEIHVLLTVRYGMERVVFGAYQSYTMASDVPVKTVAALEEERIEGINLKHSTKRVYAYPGYASHILGRLGKINEEMWESYRDKGYSLDAMVGTSGCEAEFEEHLRGKDGTLLVHYDEDGNVISTEYEEEPISGKDVYLTIDIDIQKTAEHALQDAVTSLPFSDSGSLVMLDARNNAVLAIASYPTYDLTAFSSQDYYNSLLLDPAKPLLNRALGGTYAPGSTYKLGAALAALEEHVIDAHTSVYCNRVYDKLHCPTCLGTHGDTSVVEAIAQSCNVFFYELGYQMGIDSMTAYTSRLGLGVATGIELPEQVGTLGGYTYDPSWDRGNDLSGAIGQMHSYTPLQLAVYTSTLVNGGTRYNAHLLDSVRTFGSDEIIRPESVQLDSMTISQATLTTVKQGMRQVITSHNDLSGYFASVPVQVAGKTGTAEVNGQKDNALFVGYAPYDQSAPPEIVVSCILEQGAVGSHAGKPVARVMKAYYDKYASK